MGDKVRISVWIRLIVLGQDLFISIVCVVGVLCYVMLCGIDSDH
jgi:hypothetical protein